MNRIEIRNSDRVIFTHFCENNTILKSLEKVVIEELDLINVNLTDSDLRGADLECSKYIQGQIDLAITDETTIL